MGETPKKSRVPRKGARPRNADKVAADASATGRVHLYVGISLDGYIAAPGGGLDWLNPYADARAGFTQFIKTIGSAIMGRGTYDVAIQHGYKGDAKMPSYVLTNRPLPTTHPGVFPYRGDLAALVDKLRSECPGDIWLMGGGEVAKAFHDADLIDIWSIAFIPTLLGDGIPMFPRTRFGERRLRLVHTHTYPSGVIELRYERHVNTT
jgi:dihydrofolate reductase